MMTLVHFRFLYLFSFHTGFFYLNKVIRKTNSEKFLFYLKSTDLTSGTHVNLKTQLFCIFQSAIPSFPTQFWSYGKISCRQNLERYSNTKLKHFLSLLGKYCLHCKQLQFPPTLCFIGSDKGTFKYIWQTLI